MHGRPKNRTEKCCIFKFLWRSVDGAPVTLSHSRGLVNFRTLSLTLVNLRTLSVTHVNSRAFISNFSLLNYFLRAMKSFLSFCPELQKIKNCRATLVRGRRLVFLSSSFDPGLKRGSTK